MFSKSIGLALKRKISRLTDEEPKCNFLKQQQKVFFFRVYMCFISLTHSCSSIFATQRGPIFYVLEPTFFAITRQPSVVQLTQQEMHKTNYISNCSLSAVEKRGKD